MSWYWAFILILLALVAGLVGGWRLRAWRGQAELQEELAQARAHATALESQVQSNMVNMQARILAGIEKMNTDQRAESERLLRAMREACTELELAHTRLAQSAEARPAAPQAPPGFAATMPMSEL